MTAPPAPAWIPAGHLWQCPACDKRYPRAGQSHSCVVVTLDHHFRDRPQARALFDTFRAALERIGGPVRLSVAKTRIGFIGTVTFAAVIPRKDYLRAHILLNRRADSPRFHRVDAGPPYWVHHFTVESPADLDEELCAWLAEACQVGGVPTSSTHRGHSSDSSHDR